MGVSMFSFINIFIIFVSVLLSACGASGGNDESTPVTTYSIAGSVSGLSGSGLVLRLNDATDLSVSSGASSFSFATGLSAGSSYSVSIKTQPTSGGVCTLTQESGVVSADVKPQVVVSCGSGLHLLAGKPGSEGALDSPYGLSARFFYPISAAIDSNGNVFVIETNHTIRKITPAGVVTTFAGLAGVSGSTDDKGNLARFNSPYGIAIDSQNNLFVADNGNATIRKITPDAQVSTWAGKAGDRGRQEGTGEAARFNNLYDIAVDRQDNLYVTDTGSQTIFKIKPNGVNGVVSFYAGSNVDGSADHDTDPLQASFSFPQGVAADAAGNVYVADSANHTIRKISTSGKVSTLAGAVKQVDSVDGIGSAARFYNPLSMVVDNSGFLYVADSNNNQIRKVNTSTGDVITVAGDKSKLSGEQDGKGTAAKFYYPSSVAKDRSGMLYVVDQYNNLLRKLSTSDFKVTTWAGAAAVIGSVNGSGSQAQFNAPSGSVTDSLGNVYLADSGNHTIRKITAAGAVSLFAGTAGTSGSTDSPALFNSPQALAIDSSNNLYVADTGNHTIRKITAAGVVSTIAGAAGTSGSTDSPALFNSPQGLAIDSSSLYVADTGNHTIRAITLADNTVITLAGTSGTPGSADGDGLATALFNGPIGLSANNGFVYVADTSNQTIRRIDLTNKQVTTLAGLANTPGYLDGVGSAARFNGPQHLAVDGTSSLLVTDSGNHMVRKIMLSDNSVSTLIGAKGSMGITLTALPASLYFPKGISLSNNRIYISSSNAVLWTYFTPP